MATFRFPLVFTPVGAGYHVTLGCPAVWSHDAATLNDAERAVCAQLCRWGARARARGGDIRRGHGEGPIVWVNLPGVEVPPRGAVTDAERMPWSGGRPG